jgi:hypothetical protein
MRWARPEETNANMALGITNIMVITLRTRKKDMTKGSLRWHVMHEELFEDIMNETSIAGMGEELNVLEVWRATRSRGKGRVKSANGLFAQGPTTSP